MESNYEPFMYSSQVPSRENCDKVRAALKNDNYTWRTVKGIATDTKLSEDDVRQILTYLPSEVVASNFYSAENGERLFGHRDHLLKKLGVMDQISGAFRNRLF